MLFMHELTFVWLSRLNCSLFWLQDKASTQAHIGVNLQHFDLSLTQSIIQSMMSMCTPPAQPVTPTKRAPSSTMREQELVCLTPSLQLIFSTGNFKCSYFDAAGNQHARAVSHDFCCEMLDAELWGYKGAFASKVGMSAKQPQT